MTSRKFARRSFLGALGVGLVHVRPGRAAPAKPSASGRAERFIGIYTPHGSAYELYKPGPAFDLRYADAILAPFDDPATYGRSFKDQLLVVDHIDLTAGIEVGTVGHDAPRVILTGSGAHGKNPSVDQYLAVEQGLGRSTPITSLVLGVGHQGSEIGVNISYAPGGTPIPKMIDPAEVFDELFGKPLTGKARQQLEHDRRLHRSVLDFVKSDLETLRARVSGSERVKLDQHQTALREIEKRLSGVRPACHPPLVREDTRFPRLKAFGGGEQYFDGITNVMIDLLARAHACDLTRFSTLFLADLSRSHLFPGLPDDIHGGVAHRYYARTDKNPGNRATWLSLATQNRYSYSKVARLMQRLAEAGRLDETLLYVSSDMGDPARHSSRHVPTLLAGGAGGQFAMGRYLELDPKRGTANNKILVFICQAFGLPTHKFGTSASSSVLTGALDALRG